LQHRQAGPISYIPLWNDFKNRDSFFPSAAGFYTETVRHLIQRTAYTQSACWDGDQLGPLGSRKKTKMEKAAPKSGFLR
jgi:hypothetical protein